MTGQRRYERVAFFCPLQLTVLPDGPTVSANSFDISAGGVGLTAAVFLERGKDVRIDFHVRNGSIEETDECVLGRIAYSRADEDGNRIGIEFLETIRESAQPALTRKLDML
ncbi:MAG: PilZ domain-containing protein [Planctomycetes bacterium]|nr:PilZ domain-containing protein [Planctomycetota bacterium]MBU4398791.1 PilZ domain-containing protein [Planctomycetota bacterium]MCG2682665.1 PilZ domain-containing protein [Planctomycetales bacterium]